MLVIIIEILIISIAVVVVVFLSVGVVGCYSNDDPLRIVCSSTPLSTFEPPRQELFLEKRLNGQKTGKAKDSPAFRSMLDIGIP